MASGSMAMVSMLLMIVFLRSESGPMTNPPSSAAPSSSHMIARPEPLCSPMAIRAPWRGCTNIPAGSVVTRLVAWLPRSIT